MNTNVPTFTQKAAIKAIKMQRNHILRYNSQLKFNNDYILKILKDKSKLLSIIPSDGGLFAFMNIKKTGYNSDKFCDQLLKRHQVASIPGYYFGKRWDDHVRISLIENKFRFKQAVDRLLKFENYFKDNWKISGMGNATGSNIQKWSVHQHDFFERNAPEILAHAIFRKITVSRPTRSTCQASTSCLPR